MVDLPDKYDNESALLTRSQRHYLLTGGEGHTDSAVRKINQRIRSRLAVSIRDMALAAKSDNVDLSRIADETTLDEVAEARQFLDTLERDLTPEPVTHEDVEELNERIGELEYMVDRLVNSYVEMVRSMEEDE